MEFCQPKKEDDHKNYVFNSQLPYSFPDFQNYYSPKYFLKDEMCWSFFGDNAQLF